MRSSAPFAGALIAASILSLVLTLGATHASGGSARTRVATTDNASATAPRQPIPVVLTNDALKVADSAWSKLAGVGTIALAIATFALALYTRRLAKETRSSLTISANALALERETRKDAFLPHLALIATDSGATHKTIGGGTARQVEGRELYVKNV